MDDSYVYLLLLMYDMLIVARSMLKFKKLKPKLSNEFEIRDLGTANKILGMKIHKDMKPNTLLVPKEIYRESIRTLSYA